VAKAASVSRAEWQCSQGVLEPSLVCGEGIINPQPPGD